ncbi:MAG: hypothetical protein ACYC61_25005 [Isosphaeraceae bacterium]
MSYHLHRTRQWTAWFLGALALSPFAFTFSFGSPKEGLHLSPVTGRVSFAGRPVQDMTLCLDQDGRHAAFGRLQADGSFALTSMIWADRGALPGHYHAHLYTHENGPALPGKFHSPSTSGVEIEIAPGWNDLQIELR